jgi:fumarylacetoacetase
MEISANNPSRKSFIPYSANCDFSIQNLPFGIFSTANNKQKRVGVALGDKVIDLQALFDLGYLSKLNLNATILSNESLNAFMDLGKLGTRAVRNRLAELFDSENHELQGNTEHVNKVLVAMQEAIMHLPVKVGDYTDFYSSREHATNVGTMFRDPNNALLPNWLHLPVGYHGRASSIVVSGTDIYRPKGQQKPADATAPVFGPCKLLDFELEMAFITHQGKPMGDSISTNEAEDYIFGMCLFNDWSARDIQTWEYVPLGPFLAKNFASSISPWIVTLDALEPYRVAGPKQDPEPLPYLLFNGSKSYDIQLEVVIKPENGNETRVCSSNFKYMYWNMAQQLAHHTINGCNINTGDMLASGTISGPTADSYGSMLEISWRGTKPVKMNDGSERKFIMDGDTVIMRGHCEKDGIRVGFGEVNGKVLPAK